MKGIATSYLPASLRSVGNFAVYAVVRFYNDNLSGAAAALTYTTLLALVPLMVIAFAILSSFPSFDSVQQQIERLIFDAVVPETGIAIRDYLSSFTRNASQLTTIGVVGLAVTALFLLSTIEGTLNQVWHVEHPRPILVRILMFWAVLTLGPLLIGASITLTSDMVEMASDVVVGGDGLRPSNGDEASRLWRDLLSIAITAIGLTALFVLVPARKVRVRDALIGATFAAVAFEILAATFNSFILSGETYATIYGTVVAVPVFLVWIYLSWTVIILGAVIAASLPDWRDARLAVLEEQPGHTRRIEIALRLLERLVGQSRTGGSIAEAELVQDLPTAAAQDILEDLRSFGYVIMAADGGMALARDPHAIVVAELAADLELASAGATDLRRPPRPDGDEAPVEAADGIDDLLDRIRRTEQDVLNVTVAEVLNKC